MREVRRLQSDLRGELGGGGHVTVLRPRVVGVVEAEDRIDIISMVYYILEYK